MAWIWILLWLILVNVIKIYKIIQNELKTFIMRNSIIKNKIVTLYKFYDPVTGKN